MLIFIKTTTAVKENRNWIGVLGLVIALLVLLFGNNWAFRACQKSEPEDVRKDQVDLEISREPSSKIKNELEETESLLGTNIDLALQKPVNQHDDELSLNAYPNFSIDSLRGLFISGEKEKVKKLLSEAIANDYRYDPEKLKTLNKDIAIADDLGVDVIYHDTAGDMIITELDGLYGFANLTGSVLFEPVFDEIEPVAFHPFTLVSKNGIWGVLRRNGEFLVRLEFDEVLISYDDVSHFPMKKNGKISLHEKTGGKIVLKNLDDYGRIWANHILIGQQGVYGLIDLKAKELLPVKYDTIFIPINDEPYLVAIERGNKAYFDLDINKIKNPLYD